VRADGENDFRAGETSTERLSDFLSIHRSFLGLEDPSFELIFNVLHFILRDRLNFELPLHILRRLTEILARSKATSKWLTKLIGVPVVEYPTFLLLYFAVFGISKERLR
jgi:hypothetical protein